MSFSRKDLRIIIFLAGIVCLVYLNVLGFQFVNYDDDLYVLKNPRVNSGLTEANLLWAFTDAYAANWHPLTWISHMMDVEFFGLDPSGHHVINVALHLFNSCFLFFLLKAITGVFWRPAMVATLFALHPLHVEPVVWVSQRKEVLSFAFGIISIWTYFLWTHRRDALMYSIVLFSFSCALMAKPIWVTFPILLLLLDHWPLKRLNGTTFFLRVLEKTPFFVLSIGAISITVFAQKAGLAIRTTEEYSLWVRIANAFLSYIIYLWQTVVPNNLMVFYSHPGEEISLPLVLIGSIFLVGITVYALNEVDRIPFFATGWLW